MDHYNNSWFETGGVFEATEEPLCVPLSLFTDGVNPKKHTSSQKSMWLLILTWINLPRTIRQVMGPMLLMHPKGCELKTLEPYLEILIEELLDLTEFPLQNAYIGAPTTVKVALLQFLCEFPPTQNFFISLDTQLFDHAHIVMKSDITAIL